ncbi:MULTISPECIES: acyl-CoA dehydrogenase family protein [unclassified Frankia]|uniref:acyl-CoA dehydrogenase family protein n=1 Tax=unclassified Frankia TaxID=2632575 RepID=UPI001EF3E7AA|nr:MULTISPECIES: acyl-CoA dehydrogenase family protein [unclassified Frankia]
MDVAVTAQDRQFQEEARSWLADHLTGDFRSILGVGGPADDTAWELRREWEKLLAKDKWLNIAWPVEYGGRGGTLAQEIIFQVEHARAQAPYWVGVHGRDLFGPTLLAFGTPEQKARFLPKITQVEEFWGQGFSEPDAGSDLAGLRTRAELDGDEWVINGQKIWTTFGGYADWLYVLCRTDPDAPKHRGISMLLVPRHQPGVEVRPIRNMAGGTEFAEVFLSDARTSKDLVVGEVNGGWRVVMGTLGNERGGTTVLPFQAGFEREMRALIDLVKSRPADPVLRDRIASAYVGLRVMQAMNIRTISRAVANAHPGPESSISKLFWSTWHRDFGELLMDATGADSMLVGDHYKLSLFQASFLNSRAETIYGGAVEIQHNILGEQVLGLPKEPR